MELGYGCYLAAGLSEVVCGPQLAGEGVMLRQGSGHEIEVGCH